MEAKRDFAHSSNSGIRIKGTLMTEKILPGVLNVANLIADLVLGDVNEHLPLARIPRQGNVLGLGTTTNSDNGETVFIYHPEADSTEVYKCCAHNGGTVPIQPDDGNDNFPFVCFTDNQSGQGIRVDLDAIAPPPGGRLTDWIKAGIYQLDLSEAPVYGLRVKTRWQSLVITVASKLCMAQSRRNDVSDAQPAQSIYDSLQHYYLGPSNQTTPEKMNYLGDSLEWSCCGFYDTEPHLGRITVPEADAHLHIHGITPSTGLGGHLHYEHPNSALIEISELWIHPIHQINYLSSDIAVCDVSYQSGVVKFLVKNQGELDVSDLSIDIVLDNKYSSRKYVRLPWLSAQSAQAFSINLEVSAGEHHLVIIADPNSNIIEPKSTQHNNRFEITISEPN